MSASSEGGAVLTWQQAEEVATAHMRGMGFHDATRAADGADGGVDVRSRFGVAQVKHHAKPVGSPDVQRLAGAANGSPQALFYSRNGYTRAAKAAAHLLGISLFQYDDAGAVQPANGHALRCTAGGVGLPQLQGLIDRLGAAQLRVNAWHAAAAKITPQLRAESERLEAFRSTLPPIEELQRMQAAGEEPDPAWVPIIAEIPRHEARTALLTRCIVEFVAPASEDVARLLALCASLTEGPVVDVDLMQLTAEVDTVESRLVEVRTLMADEPAWTVLAARELEAIGRSKNRIAQVLGDRARVLRL